MLPQGASSTGLTVKMLATPSLGQPPGSSGPALLTVLLPFQREKTCIGGLRSSGVIAHLVLLPFQREKTCIGRTQVFRRHCTSGAATVSALLPILARPWRYVRDSRGVILCLVVQE